MSTPRKPKAAAESVVPNAEPNEVAEVPAAAAEVVAAPPLAPEVAPAPVVAAPGTAAPEAAVPAPAISAAAPPPPPPPAAPTAPAGPPAGAQVAAAISGLASGIKDRLGPAELMLGGGALLIAGFSFLLLDFILGTRGPSETAVIVSALLLGLIALERTEREGFGSWYRVLLVVLGGILAIGAVYSLLSVLRHSTSSLDGLDWLAMLGWWIGGVLAGIGAWMTYRVRA